MSCGEQPMPERTQRRYDLPPIHREASGLAAAIAVILFGCFLFVVAALLSGA